MNEYLQSDFSYLTGKAIWEFKCRFELWVSQYSGKVNYLDKHKIHIASI